MNASPVTLPGGFEAEGAWRRDATLRPVNGEDEDFLRTSGDGLLPAERLTALLARCVVRLGPWDGVTLDGVRGLSAGDRDALALHLRRLTFGDRLDCVLTCPACGERMDVELSASALLLPPYDRDAPGREVVVTDGDERRVYRLRAPTGRELEDAARVAVRDPARAEAYLLRACVTSADKDGRTKLPEASAAQLAEALAQLDPQADLLVDMACPNCGAPIQTPFDPADFLFQELSRRGEALYREVHTLALYYHWSERDILTMPARKRHMYLSFLAEALARPEAEA